MAARSRMNREVHVRICEGLGVKFPGATRPVAPQYPCSAYSSFSFVSSLVWSSGFSARSVRLLRAPRRRRMSDVSNAAAQT